MRKSILLIFGLLISLTAFADTNKIEANAVIFQYDGVFTMHSSSSGSYKVHKVIMVANRHGLEAASIELYSDSFNTISSFSGSISYKGKTVKRIKKSDLDTRAVSLGLADDLYVSTYEPSASYPFTVEYNYEISYKKGIYTFPTFLPVHEEKTVCLSAKYSIIVPSDKTVQYHSSHTPEIEKGKRNTYTWKFSYNGFQEEQYMPSFRTIVPYVYASPTEFEMSKTKGEQTTWKGIGSWIYSLMDGTSNLNEKVKSHLREMTAGCKNDYEKVRIIYNYLREKTRYVSIQYGIGGFKPFAAQVVEDTGFGDCKALSNYAMAMLDAVGVKSYYYIISTFSRDLLEDYASAVGQMNHVMLAVPLIDETPMKGDTLWLECTNPVYPLGYKHEDVAGHKVVLIKEDGGELVKVSGYNDSLSKRRDSFDITIAEDGSAAVNCKRDLWLDFTEPYLRFTQRSKEAKDAALTQGLKSSAERVIFKGIKDNFEEYQVVGKEFVPHMELDYSFKMPVYSKKSKERLFIPVNPANFSFEVQRGERLNDIYIKYGYSVEFDIFITIPEGYKIEGLGKGAFAECKWLTFKSEISREERTVHIHQCIVYKAGLYPKSDYEEFRQFAKVCNKELGSTMVIVKE